MIDLTKIQPPDVHADSFMVGAFVSLTSRVGPALPPGVETKPQDLGLRSFKGSRYSSGQGPRLEPSVYETEESLGMFLCP